MNNLLNLIYRKFTIRYKFRIIHISRSAIGDFYAIQYKPFQWFPRWLTLKAQHGISLETKRPLVYTMTFTREDAEHKVSEFYRKGWKYFSAYKQPLRNAMWNDDADITYTRKEYYWEERGWQA